MWVCVRMGDRERRTHRHRHTDTQTQKYTDKRTQTQTRRHTHTHTHLQVLGSFRHIHCASIAINKRSRELFVCLEKCDKRKQKQRADSSQLSHTHSLFPPSYRPPPSSLLSPLSLSPPPSYPFIIAFNSCLSSPFVFFNLCSILDTFQVDNNNNHDMANLIFILHHHCHVPMMKKRRGL